MTFHQSTAHGLTSMQKIALTIMGVLVLLTFVVGNLHALLWQQSAWLVATVLPAVVVELTNGERTEQGVPTLHRNATLDEAARLKAEHMAKHEYFAHYSPDGVSPWYWFSEAGYVYAHAGENLAIHFTDSTQVVEAWMKSPSHRANIVNNQYAEIGVGTAKGTFDGFNTVYVVQLFGTPAVPAPVTAPAVVLNNTPPAPTPVIVPVVPVVVSLSTDSPTVAGEDSTNVLPEEELQLVRPLPPTPTPAPAPVFAESLSEVPRTVAVVDDVVVIESTVATSSGLAIASITEPREPASIVRAGVMTKPQQLFTYLYLMLAAAVVLLLAISGVTEARRLHFMQFAYSILLLVGMSGLWYLHQLLTSGAVIA